MPFREREPSDLRARHKEALRYTGNYPSSVIFSHLETSWKELDDAVMHTGKPIADFGSGISPLPTEGELRDITIVPVDLTSERDHGYYERRIVAELFNSRAIRTVFPKIDFDRLLPDSGEHNAVIQKALRAAETVKGRYVEADLADLPFRDRHFSVGLAHDSVPKHSEGIDEFADEQLPEMLRVTNEKLLVYPMAKYQSTARRIGNFRVGRDNLQEVWNAGSDLSINRQIAESARRSDFTFATREIFAPYTPIERMPAVEKQTLGIFQRRNT